MLTHCKYGGGGGNGRICISNKFPVNGSRDHRGPHVENHGLNQRAKTLPAWQKCSFAKSSELFSAERRAGKLWVLCSSSCPPRACFYPYEPLCSGWGLRLEEPSCWAPSARPVHSRVSSDSILITEGRAWSRAAHSTASREVLACGLGLEKLREELRQATAQACLCTLSVATDRMRVGHRPARWR